MASKLLRMLQVIVQHKLVRMWPLSHRFHFGTFRLNPILDLFFGKHVSTTHRSST